ncbi:MAG: hypothetical protein QME62_09315 [Armatimonadota bacterium]|nr:hypothetical protein [Armatimonadota bacterium]
MEEQRQENLPSEEAGRKGGAAAMAAGVPTVGTRAEAIAWTRDRVRWGPVWAGFLVTLGAQVVLGACGLAVALSLYNPAAPDFAARVSNTLGIWSGISMLVVLFIGGYIAGRMAAVAGLKNGLAQGTMVWALALMAGTVLSAFGISWLLGAAQSMLTALSRLNISPSEAQAAVGTARNAAIYFAISAILAWAAAAGGGILGAARREEEIETMAQ